MAATELYIALSDKCNFHCSHCLNRSGPNANKWQITKSEIEFLAGVINKNTEIEQVHFSGGEPTLFLDEIQSLQRQITRPVKYLMTTNGSFWKDTTAVLDKVQIESFVLSWDRFRKPFIEKMSFIALANHLQRLGYEVSVNLVIAKAEDLQELEDFERYQIPVMLNGIISSGRFSDPKVDYYKDGLAIQRTCPSFKTVIDQGGLFKVVYIANHGFTPCCGPLAFDKRADNDFIFSKDWRPAELARCMDQGSFSDQAARMGLKLQEDDYNSACEACVSLYGRHGGIPSLRELSQSQGEQHFPITARLNPIQERLIEQKWNMIYSETKDGRVEGIRLTPRRTT